MQVAQQVDGVNGQTLKNFLMHQNYRLVNHVLKARLSFHFEKEGGGSVTVEGAIPNTPISAEANPKFKWKNQATIESTEPIIVAVKLADWHNGRGMFVADH